ncbi:redoxin domain-containing protein [Roseisolibacter sp. H3M3-2]|uniref:peroxiredoxin n=1 Tax=Roseisolibacter sp. H3M3-2 TaxID=3031323 RepID=UPI0023DCD37B|nr:redoxin domain-containing protein [Roseisolibacter sp. H3M3-2]MDF1503984.1 redoxin domain-containing protein [Roseisolibacter sp. H3M3-2]
MTRLSLALAAAALLAAPAARAQDAPPQAPPAPEVGAMAPDFSLAWADGSGARSAPASISAHRGKVVVLAFYPKDRTTGCTAELTKFRDEYDTLFGKDVVVLPISVDDVASHTAWAKDMNFPFALVADPQLTAAAAYGSHVPGRPTSGRTVFVIGKDGRIAWRDLRFNALNEGAYTAMAEAVAKARGN